MDEYKKIMFRLTKEEKEIADKTAKKYGMTINAIAKFLLLNLKEPKGVEQRKEKKELNRQVGAIGNNLNQIAKQLNTQSFLLPSEKKELISMLKDIRKNTLELVGREPVEEKIEEPKESIFKRSNLFK